MAGGSSFAEARGEAQVSKPRDKTPITAVPGLRDLAVARPLPTAAGNDLGTATVVRAVVTTTTRLLLLVQDQLQNIIRELRELETHGLELRLGVVAQAVAAGGPESGYRLADGDILGVALGIDIASVGKLALGRGGSAVDLAVGQRFQLGKL